MNWGDFISGALFALVFVNFLFSFERWKRSRK